MEIKKIFFYLSIGVLLSGCPQTTAMVGPALTLVGTGNYPQATLSFITNKAIEEETGMNSVAYVSKKIEENHLEQKRKKRHIKLMVMVKSNIENTRKIILEKKSNKSD